MKKIFSLFLAVCILFSFAAFSASAASDVSVAVFTYTDGKAYIPYSLSTAEACVDFCTSNSLPCMTLDTDDLSDVPGLVEEAVSGGRNVLVFVGGAFAPALKDAVSAYPSVKFIGLDVSDDDLGKDYVLPSNLCCCKFQEEVLGYITGYALTKLGYTQSGILMSPDENDGCIRLGYGFIQGVNAAGEELNNLWDLHMNYAYVYKTKGDADLTYSIDTWYLDGTEIIFTYGNTIYTSVGEAAQKTEGKVIGALVDQSAELDEAYGEGITVSSALKNVPLAATSQLQSVLDGSFAGGSLLNLGIVSKVPAENYVLLSDSTLFNDTFTREDYAALIEAFYAGGITVDNDTTLEMIDMEGSLNVQMFDTLEF